MKLVLISIIAFVGYSGASDPGDACSVAGTGAAGTCKILSQCPSAIEDIVKRGRFPTQCGFIGRDQVVCCQNPPTRPTMRVPVNSGRISARKCAEYQEYVYENVTIANSYGPASVVKQNKCSFTSVPFIVGGQSADPKEFPHMVLLGFQPYGADKLSFECGGSLISENFVLTAAHCISPNRILGNVSHVLVGEYILERDDEDARPLLLKVVERIVHEGFKLSSKYNDIALLRLERNVPISQYVRPACLAETFNDATAGKALASGWGRLEHRGQSSTILMKVVLEMFTREECTATYRNEARLQALNRGIVDDEQFCAGSHTEHKDTCQGDSGGPIQINHPFKTCMYLIVGITSFGKKCGEINQPGVYTRVYGYLDWIERNVWPNER